MEGVIWLLTVTVAILIIYLWYWVAKQFYLVAVEKGYTDKKYLWISFWLAFVGYALVIALPDRKGMQSNNIDNAQQISDELPDL